MLMPEVGEVNSPALAEQAVGGDAGMSQDAADGAQGAMGAEDAQAEAVPEMRGQQAEEMPEVEISSSKSGKYRKMVFRADMSKANDRINWHFIRATLLKMGFPDWTIELIMKCISSVSYEILINCIPSQKILPQCELRQGKSSSSCSTLASTISNYFQSSGQRINEAISAIIISPSSSLSFPQDCFKYFLVSPTAEMVKYLGLPTDISISEYGKSKRDIFNFLIDNVKKRTSSWNGLLLSSVGRLSLISSILSSLSTYFLSMFKMPALLAKIGWNMLRDPSSLISQTVGVELDLDWTNCINRVETVRSKDSWICSIPIPKHYDLLLVESSLSKLRVKELISANSTWNVDMVTCYFEDSFIAKILAISLSKENKEDFVFYKVSNNGNYYVKKGSFDVWQDYWNLKTSVKDLSRISSRYRAFIKKWLWHLPEPKRWIILLWKILTQTLSFGRELEKRGIGDGFFCRLCDRECVESLEHLFWDCEFVSRLWSANHLDINANSGSNISIQEWITNWLSLLRKENSIDGVISFMCTIWTIWVTWNTHVFSNEPLSPFGSIRLYEHELSLMISAEKERAISRKDLNNTCLLDDDDFNLKVLHNGNTFPLIGLDFCENHYLIYTDAAWRSNFSSGLG
ncbi:uncharacterized protein LOC141641485 [Silene latifolia]|uniref:uncharacterized protein LOC141641485 n=1 Tax=Silene latifolia TaxID=37657 RepID=UPI003D778735